MHFEEQVHQMMYNATEPDIRATERSIKAAVEEVEPLPHYTNKGEVINISTPYCEKPRFPSGLSLMRGIIEQPMPTTQQCGR